MKRGGKGGRSISGGNRWQGDGARGGGGRRRLMDEGEG